MSPIKKKYFIKKNSSIKTALYLLNVSPFKCLLVVNDHNKLLGTITDGDIRKSILTDANLNRSINNIYNKKPIKINKDSVDMNKIKKLLQLNKFDLIPLVDNKNIILDIFTWDQFFKVDQEETLTSNIDLIIMAGGRGKRLIPFTNKYPKALMPIGGIPMIIRILEKYYMAGFTNFYVSTYYQKNILKDVIKKKFLMQSSSNLSFIDEQKPLGTIGAIRKLNIQKISNNFIVTNCDTIIDANIDLIIEKHIKSKADLTLILTKKNISIPYGQVTITKNNKLLNIAEKPNSEILINAGFYIIKRELIKLIPKNKYFDATDLILKAKKENKNIMTYTISDNNWIEIGRTNDLESLNKLIKID